MPLGSDKNRSPKIDRLGVYLRYGVVLPENGELKFNPYRAEDGRFDFAPGHGTLRPRTHSVGSVAMTGRVQREMAAAGPSYNGPIRNPSSRQGGAPARSRYPSSLSAKYESGGPGDPGAISSVPGDPGGRSYGKYQLASKSRMIHAFIRSPEASRWAGDFRGLTPVTPRFDSKWKQVAARDAAAFGMAQENFIGRTNYDPVIRDVLRSTGLNLDGASEAVRRAAYSAAIQHGKARDVLREAVLQADGQLKRSDPRYQRVLVEAIYDRRTAYVTKQRNDARAAGRVQRAQVLDRSVVNRYPNERADALQLPGAR